MRNTGIDIIDTVPWGTHFCQFYRNRRELTDIVAPYLKAGLESNEYCLWITPPGLTVRQARAALLKTVPQLNEFIKSGRIEILPHADWCPPGGEFKLEAVRGRLFEKLNAAQERGFDGMRLAGGIAGLENGSWDELTACEEAITLSITDHKFLVLCTYNLHSCGPLESLDVVRNHQFALISRGGNWELVKGCREAVREKEDRLRILGDNLPDSLVYQYTHENGKPKFLYISAGCERLNGVTAEQVLADAGVLHRQLDPDEVPKLIEAEEASARDLTPFEREVRYHLPDGRIRWMHLRAMPRRLPGGQVIWDGVQTDITDRKNAEQVQQTILKRFYASLSSLYGSILLVTNEGRVEFANQAFCDMFDIARSPAELVGASQAQIFDMIRGAYADPEGELARIREIVRNQEPVRGEEVAMSRGRATLRDYVPIYLDNKPYGRLWYHNDITDRKLAEQQTQESRAKLEAALASMTDAVFISDTGGRFLQFNDAFATFHRFKTREACPTSYRDFAKIIEFIRPDGSLRPLDMWSVPRALRGESGVNDEYTVRRKDTGETWIGSYSYGPIRDGEGKIIGAVVTARDITDQKRAQEALAQAKQDLEVERDTLQAVMNGAQNSHLVYLDADFNYVRVNEVYARSCGYAPEQMVGLNLLGLYPSPEMETILRRVRETGEPDSGRDAPFEFPDQPERGVTYWDWTLSPVKDHAGNVVGLIFSLYETTERKKAEEELQFALDRLELAHRAAGAGAWDWNIVAGKIEWTDKMFALLGLDPDRAQASFESWRTALHPDDLAAAEARIERAINEHKALVSEYRVVWPDGRVRWISAMGEATYNDDGQPVRMTGICTDITDRKRTEEALRASEQRFRRVYESGLLGIVYWNMDGIITDANDKFLEMVGYGRDDLASGIIDWKYSMTPPEYRAQDDEVLRELKATGVNAHLIEKEYIRKDGSRISVMIRAVMLDEARFNGVAFVLDISQRKRAEEELRRNREWLSVTLSSIGDAVVAADADGAITFFNPVAAELTGWPVDDALGRPILEVFQIVNEQTGQPFPDLVGEVLSEGAIFNLANHAVLIRRDGGRIPIEDSAAPIREADGHVSGVVVVFHDVTEKRRAQKALTESEKELRLVMDTVPALIAYVGSDMRYLRVNKGFEKMSGRSADQIEGHHVREIIGEASWHRVEKEIRKVLAGETVVSEQQLEYFDGHPWAQLILVPDRDASGRVQGYVVHIMDISNRKQAEQELAALQHRQAMILNSIADGFFSIDRDWRMIHVNDATLRYYSKSREAVIGRTLQEVFPEVVGSPLEKNFRLAMETGEPVHFIEPSVILKGHILEMNVYPGPDNVTVLFRDVTERIAREADLHRLNRTLNALSHSDSAMMRATDEPGYVAEVCRLVIEDCGHALVWVGYAEDDEARTVRPVAFSGFDEEYIRSLNISWGDNERGRGPTGTAIRTGRPYICRNIETDPTFGPWREQALRRGYASAAVMPLNAEDRTLGVLSIYSRTPDSFSDEETRLLLRLADDLAHGIQTLRVRAARLRAEAELKANLARFKLLADSAGRFLQASHPQEIIGSVCDRAMQQLDCHAYFNFLLDEATDRLHMNAYAGIPDKEAHADEWLEYGTTISGTVARDGVQILVERVQQSTDPRTERIRSFGLNAYACFPMLAPGGKVIGTLGFGTRTRQTLSDSDISLMKAITDQVTVAMIRVKVEDDLRKSQAELVELNRTLEDRIAERTSQLDQLNADLERRAHQLRALAQELTETEERERRRLADILHDDLQQLLVGAKLHLGLLPSRFPQAYGSELIAQITRMLDESISKSRGLAQELSPPLLHQQGLVATLDWLGRQMKSKYGLNVRIAAAFNIDVPEPIKVFLFRAAQEMLFNVVKHAGVSDAAVEVEHAAGMVRLKVSDQGKGFAVEHGLPAGWGTSGFGLFSIHERANLLGGRLKIESAPGLGSHFTLEIPIEPTIPPEAELAAAQGSAVETLPPGEAVKGQSIRVLLVDDHQVMRQGLAAMLFNAPDLEVVGEAEDGRQAVDMVQACQPDVIIMDVSMPIMDGIEATRVIKREWPAMRIIGLSMFEEEDLAKAMIDAGAESYLSKAMGLKELVDVIRKPRPREEETKN
ncbi:MAG: PAS domain S-box protein [Candidatus Sumerlaeia bacterium]